MAEIKWIKITTDIFDDEKIKIIDTMPARDEILVIWFKLLTLSGKVNRNGALFMNTKIAYTPEMMSAIFNRKLAVIKMALEVFESFEMIEVEANNAISISNWEKHQNIEGMDKIRTQNNIRQKKLREKRKLELQESNVTSNVTVTQSNATDKEENKIKNKNKIKNTKSDFKKIPEPTKLDFDLFWNLYDKKTGKDKCLSKWNKLNLETQTKILEYIPKYKIAQPDKKFRKNPETFLNNKSWEDEIISKSNNNNTSTLQFLEKKRGDDFGSKPMREADINYIKL